MVEALSELLSSFNSSALIAPRPCDPGNITGQSTSNVNACTDAI